MGEGIVIHKRVLLYATKHRICLRELWGQLTALAVELSAILAGTWSYVDDLWFNPVMFWFRGHPVTAAMQLTWLLAPLCFAALVRRLALTAR